ncbi:MAG: hypothetical protein ACR2J8_07685 [Thermomicrobiales bacterium]
MDARSSMAAPGAGHPASACRIPRRGKDPAALDNRLRSRAGVEWRVYDALPA